MATDPNPITIPWRAQADDLIGGWCITDGNDPRTPADGARQIANFIDEYIAHHVAMLHNQWLRVEEDPRSGLP